MKHKYTTIFSSTIRPLVSEEKDKYLAMASLVDIGDFIPDINTEENIDLLPIAFNACVVNRVNLNGDVIDAKTALSSYKNFINKPINLEHQREKVVGCILTAGFSEFGTDAPLTEEEIKDTDKPFNITLGGIIWKVVNTDLADMIEESGDPSDENFMRISASWELGFSDFQIIKLPFGEKNTENGELISDESLIQAIQDNLKAFGGKGCLDENICIHRQVINKVVPLGIGLTETPAADVKGVATLKTMEKSISTEEKPEDLPCLDELVEEKISLVADSSKDEEILDNISQNEENNVILKENTMKLTSVKDITDESLKTLTASVIAEFIEEEMKIASEKFAEEKTAVEAQLQESDQKQAELTHKNEEIEKELGEMKSALTTLEEEKTVREAEATFNERMSLVDEGYVLNDEDREVIASDIKDMNDEAFQAYVKKLAVLINHKSAAEVEKAKAEAEVEQKEQVETKASSEAENAEEVVESAVEAAEKQEETVPNSTSPSKDTVYDRYRDAFSIEQFDITK